MGVDCCARRAPVACVDSLSSLRFHHSVLPSASYQRPPPMLKATTSPGKQWSSLAAMPGLAEVWSTIAVPLVLASVLVVGRVILTVRGASTRFQAISIA